MADAVALSLLVSRGCDRVMLAAISSRSRFCPYQRERARRDIALRAGHANMRVSTMLRSLLLLMLAAGAAHAAEPAKTSPTATAHVVLLAAEMPLPPGGKVLPWDRYAVAWLHPTTASPQDLDVARRRAARIIEVADPGRLVSLSLARLSLAIGKGAWPSFFVDSALARALDAGTVDFELFIDLPAMARACSTVAGKERLHFELRADIGLIRMSDRAFEHRLWLTDVPSRMMWTGQPFLPAWLAMLGETRAALAGYGRLRRQLEKFAGGKVEVRGPELVNENLPPRGTWRYQEMVAEGVTSDAMIRLYLIEKRAMGGTLVQVPLPAGADPVGQGARTAPVLTRAGGGYQAGYLIERPEGAGWLTPRMAQDRGWEPEALDERVARDAPFVPLRGWLVAVPGYEGRVLLAVGRYASALALHPGAMRAVVDGPLKKPSRVRAFSATTHALVITVPEVPREELDRLGRAALAAQSALLGTPTAPVTLELWVDLPADPSGRVAFTPIAAPRGERSEPIRTPGTK